MPRRCVLWPFRDVDNSDILFIVSQPDLGPTLSNAEGHQGSRHYGGPSFDRRHTPTGPGREAYPRQSRGYCGSPASRLDEDEKGRHSVTTPGGPQQLTIVSEPGLYSLVATSRKPEAKAFTRWVRHEVLPAIRKTGDHQIRTVTIEGEPWFVAKDVAGHSGPRGARGCLRRPSRSSS